MALEYSPPEMAMDVKDNSYLLLKNLMDNMTDHIYFKDLESHFLLINKACADWLGFRHPDDAVGKSDFDIYKTDVAQHMFDCEQQIIETGEPFYSQEERVMLKSEREAWESTKKMPLLDRTGETIGTFGITRDVSEQKEAELRAERYAEEIRDIKEGMEEDVRMAAGLQKTFFPHMYPSYPEGAPPGERAVDFLHYYHASGMVSGDFCTIRRLSSTEAGVFLCDVMGHGVRAALGTAVICAMVEEAASIETSPGAFLARMNKLLLPILRQEDMFLYATACYLIIDTTSGRLRMANAGHPAPLHFHGSERSVGWLAEGWDSHGPALAIAEEVEYQTFETYLQPGDAVVMYTDGLYEVAQADGEELGEQRLLEAASNLSGHSLEEIFPGLIGVGRHFSGSGDFDDDICLVGLKYNQPTSSDHAV